MKWCTINKKYMNYLREKEGRIPEIEYGSRLKPFFSPLFEIEGLVYVTQVSSPKERHEKLKKSLDFIKLYHKDNSLMGVVNLNFMFPVPKELIIEITGTNISTYRTFDTEQSKSKYIDLLKQEMAEIIKNNIGINANDLYKLKSDKPDNPISKRCLDFKKLEIEAKNYKEV